MKTSFKHGYIVVTDNGSSAILDTYNAELYHSVKNHEETLQDLEEREEEPFRTEYLPSQPTTLNQLVVNSADCCNLKCTYCYANEGTYNQEKHVTSFSELKNIYEMILTIYVDGIGSINFFGGEPLLAFDSIIEFCRYVEQDAAIRIENNPSFLKPTFSIITNGTLIDDSAARFLKDHDFSIVVSLDGPEEVNNLCRISDTLDNVFRTVSDNLLNLQKYGLSYSCECTFTDQFLATYTSGMMDHYLDSLFDLGFTSVGCVLEKKRRLPQSIEQLKPILKNLYSEIVDYSFKTLCSDDLPSRYPLLVLKTIQNITKRRETISCSAGSESIFSNWRGDIYPCQTYYAAGKKKLGNVFSQADQIKVAINSFTRVNNSEIAACKDCYSYGYCTTICPGSSLQLFNDEYKVDELDCYSQKVMLSRCIYNMANLTETDHQKFIESFMAEINNKKRWLIASEK